MLNCGRTLRLHAHLRVTFWGDCVLALVYLISHTPTSLLQGKYPDEIMYNTTP